jgi:hypothetical protein
VTIGGDDTAFSASKVSDYALSSMGVNLAICHVPKTIDNDLPLPEGIPTFGFQTAREIGTQLIKNLAEDAKTTSRWYLTVIMGRTAGHLALGCGKSAGATITIIPESFREPVRISVLADILAASIIKRLAFDRPYGVAVLADPGPTVFDACFRDGCREYGGFASVCEYTSRDASCNQGAKGVLLAPLGYSLALTGLVWSLGTRFNVKYYQLDSWIPIALGLAAGAISYGVSVAADDRGGRERDIGSRR